MVRCSACQAANPSQSCNALQLSSARVLDVAFFLCVYHTSRKDAFLSKAWSLYIMTWLYKCLGGYVCMYVCYVLEESQPHAASPHMQQVLFSLSLVCVCRFAAMFSMPLQLWLKQARVHLNVMLHASCTVLPAA